MVVSIIPSPVLSDVDSTRRSTAGLKLLETILESAQIVGVGESAHFTSEGQSPKARQIRSQSASAVTDIGKAFDAVICTPRAAKDKNVCF